MYKSILLITIMISFVTFVSFRTYFDQLLALHNDYSSHFKKSARSTIVKLVSHSVETFQISDAPFGILSDRFARYWNIRHVHVTIIETRT